MAYFHCITGNGGGEAPYGFLTVNYPSGATLSVTNCQSTYKQLTTTSRLYYVNAPSSGSSISCVVTISQSGQTSVTQTVAFTEEAQTKSVTLSFFTATITVTSVSGAVVTASMTGQTDVTGTVPSGETTVTLTVHATGTWTITDDQSLAVSVPLEVVSTTTSYSVTIEHKLYLYKEGDEYTTATGGWSASGYSYSGWSGDYCSKEATYLKICGKQAGGSNGGHLGTADLIDLSGCTYLHVRWCPYTNNSQGGLYVSSTKTNYLNSGNYSTHIVPTITSGAEQTLTASIASVSSGYVVACVVGNVAINVYEVWADNEATV